MSKITENDAVQMNFGLQMIIFGPNIATNTLLTRNPINIGRLVMEEHAFEWGISDSFPPSEKLCCNV